MFEQNVGRLPNKQNHGGQFQNNKKFPMSNFQAPSGFASTKQYYEKASKKSLKLRDKLSQSLDPLEGGAGGAKIDYSEL